jgi:hypothetical protein
MDALAPHEAVSWVTTNAAPDSWWAGPSGLALTNGVVARALQDHSFSERAERLLQVSIDMAASTPLVSGYLSSFASLGFVTDYLSRLVDGAAYADGADIDEIVAGILDREADRLRLDLLGGLVGAGVYALSRTTPAADDCIRIVIRELRTRAVECADGMFWFRSGRFTSEYEQTHFGNAVIDLGVAHGLAGIIGFLGQAVGRDVEKPIAASLLDGAARWLIHRYESEDRYERTPDGLAPILKLADKATWCRGILGASVALLIAARAAEHEALEEFALRAVEGARVAAERLEAASESGICHGSAGLMLGLRRAYDLVGTDDLLRGSETWLAKVLAERQIGTGIGGFRARHGYTLEWTQDPGLLSGSAGVALSILHAFRDVELPWDFMLMLSPAVPGKAR